jgi:hypothetical protein
VAIGNGQFATDYRPAATARESPGTTILLLAVWCELIADFFLQK